jgi:hypothetical protein
MSEKIIPVESGMEREEDDMELEEDDMELDNLCDHAIDSPRDDAEADAKLKDDAYMLSLLLESTTSTKTRTDDDSGRGLWEDLPWWLGLHQRLQHNYLTAVLAGPTAIVKDWSKKPVPYEQGHFDLFSCDDSWCVSFLRFTKRQICELCVLLDIPERFEYGCRAHPTTALSLVLYRLSYPKRLKDCMDIFGNERSWLCWVFNGTCQYIYKRYYKKLKWDDRLLSPQALDRYCMVVKRKGDRSGRI